MIRLFQILTFICYVLLGQGGYSQEGQVQFPEQLPACPAEFLTDSLLASNGVIWVSSEGKGIYRYIPGNGKGASGDWQVASYYQGLPDTVNFYALAEDHQGRIWAGSDNKGVAVFNGEKWQVYDRENALLGERVFDIAVSPKTGDVAIATSGGISIYQPSKKEWLGITRADGLAEDQVKSLSYDLLGNLWVAYACGGVSSLSEADGYKVGKTVQAKWYWDESSGARQPLDSTGEGLPSNLSNALLVLRNGGIVVGTTSGLGWMETRKNGKWKYLRGKNYRNKNDGLLKPPSKTGHSEQTGLLLPEDYVTCLLQTNKGLWVGFREKGASLLDPSSMRKKEEGKFPEELLSPWVTSMVAMPNGAVYATTYGAGMIKIHESNSKTSKLKIASSQQVSEHPSSAGLVSKSKLIQEFEKRDKLKPLSSPVVFWKEDWATQGDWCERYGTHYALLCATDQPRDDEVRTPVKIQVEGEIGKHKFPQGDLYLKFFLGDVPDDINVVYNPNTGTRTAAQWSDRSKENYPVFFDGPDIWVVVDVPEGAYEIALYFYNRGDQDSIRNVYKDYLLEVRQSETLSDSIDTWKDEVTEMMKSPVLTRTRVSEFNKCGLYKSFFTAKAGRYYIRIVNNYSSKTILNAVLVNQIDVSTGIPKNTDDLIRAAYGSMPPQPAVVMAQEQALHPSLQEMWHKALSPVSSGDYLSQNQKILYSLYRIANSKNDLKSVVRRWRWFLRMWSADEHDDFGDFMLKSWYSKQEEYLLSRSEEFFPYSPRVIPFSPKEIKVMYYLHIDWKSYLPDSKENPKISAMELKERVAKMSEEEYKKIEKDFFAEIEKNSEKENNEEE